VLFEMEYRDEPPFPAAADGAGHSLVLARPSYGEGDPRAWEASGATGGNPGAANVPPAHPYRTLMINEFLAHTDPPDVDFVELYNYGNTTVSLSRCILTDEWGTNRFVIPQGTVIAPRGYAIFTAEEMGFALSSAGETLALLHPTGRTVIDAWRFGGQENGVATGR
jgi:hypothetical protein